MTCLIVAEAAIFIIFVVAYVYYIGKSLTGPTPHDVLKLPIFTTVCLLSSSLTVHFAVAALYRANEAYVPSGLRQPCCSGPSFSQAQRANGIN
jgi:cytochrome c oxidase subunit 3